MNNPLRILHLEDDESYCDLIKDMMEADGFQIETVHVKDRPAYEEALEQHEFDLILADYLLPAFNGLTALRIARERCPATPFLLISGTITESAAIESLRSGATDYVLKHWPERLIPAVRRALQEADERERCQRVETELIRREKYFRALTENALDILSILNAEGTFVYNSPSSRRVLGYDPKDMQGLNAFSMIHPDDLPRVLIGFEHGLNNPDQTVTLQFRFLHRNGSWRHLEAVGQSRLADPEIAGIVVNSRDITDRLQAEGEVRQSERQYRLIFDGNPIPMWVFDHETLAFLEVNDAAIQHYGYSREEFLRMNIRDIRAPEEIPAMVEYLHRLTDSKIPPRLGLAGIWRHRKKDGTYIDVEVKWSPISFKGRNASLTMANDITERKRIEHSEAALAKLGQQLSTATSPEDAAQIIKSVADDLFTWDAFTLDLYSAERGEVSPILNVDTNRAGQRFEIDVSTLPSKPSGMARRVVESGAQLILRNEPIRMPPDVVPMGDKSRPSASIMLAPVRSRTRVIGIVSIQSYTLRAYDHQNLGMLQTLADHCGGALERIRAEQALHDSEQRFRELFEGSPDAVFVEDLHGVVLDVNPAACRLHGMRREQLVGLDVSQLVPPEVSEQVRRDFQSLVEGKAQQIEGSSYTMDGRSVPVEVRANRITYAGGEAVLLHVRDITDRKLAEAALRSSEMLFHSVWENSVDGMWLIDHEGLIVTVNEPFCRLVGQSRSELEGRLFTSIYSDIDEQAALAAYREHFAERATETQVERHRTLRNGNAVVFEETTSFVESNGQRPLLLGLLKDVTDQKRLEEQLRQSQKMEAIGQLAGGVAHDFNNILTVIHGHASLLLAAGGLAGPAVRSAQQIAQAADRAAALTRQLLAFGRRQVMQPRLLDVNEIVAHMTKMLGRILGEDIALQLNYLSQPALVNADAGMMEQILLNLAVNSRDAMPKGGLLTIKISLSDIHARQAGDHPDAHKGKFVCLSVIDTGCGIKPENLRRIFEPFFTTKEIGKGTGLGLATVYGIVKQHRGWIEVESEINSGTTFRVFLPQSKEAPSQTDAQPADTAIPGGAETILVVEDEAPVRELVCRLLAQRGYHILEAESGLKALEIWNHSKGKIDLVLTDLVMPDHINGRELAEKLWAERPDLKVIFTSGYSQDVVGKDFVLNQGLNYVQKPYHPQKLAQTIRECLDGRTPATPNRNFDSPAPMAGR
jgi:PAS domain S-box-containing protein